MLPINTACHLCADSHVDAYYKTTACAHIPPTNSIYLMYQAKSKPPTLCSRLSKPFTLQPNQVLFCKGVSALEKAGGGKGDIHQKEISFQNFSHLLVFKDWVLQTLLLMPGSQRYSEFSYPEPGCQQSPGMPRHPAAPHGTFHHDLKMESSPNAFNTQIKNLILATISSTTFKPSLHSASLCWS